MNLDTEVSHLDLQLKGITEADRHLVKTFIFKQY